MIEAPEKNEVAHATSANQPENRPGAGATTVFDVHRLKEYLARVLGLPVEVHSVTPLRAGESTQGADTGVPLKIDYSVGDEQRAAVLETLAPGSFDRPEGFDRAQAHLWAHEVFHRLPRDARSLGAGTVEAGEELVSLSRSEEYFLLTEFVEGRAYGEDLVRLKLGGPLSVRDRERSDALADYLVQVHQEPRSDPGLYVRRVRELLGFSASILERSDSYPSRQGSIHPEILRRLEHRCLDWRWRLKDRTHRLRRIHGDFHPWNILFREGADFTVLDRSGSQWGDPAHDVTCLSMNYLFFALQAQGRSRKALVELFRRFWGRYLEKSGDVEMLEVAAPFLVLHGLGMASPVWHPALDDKIRQALFLFMSRVLESPRFEPERVEGFLSEG